MVNPELIQAIAHDLESHAHSTRVRKLIFYICKRTWENDLTTLNSYALSHLIQELIQLYPSLTELENQLNRVAQSLSKPAEYSLTASLILQKIRRLYSENKLEASFDKQQQLSQVVSSLSQDVDSTRIKKILIYICRNVWENNSDRLNQYNLKDLIEEVLQIAPTLSTLGLVLNSIVKTLNRQTEYSLVANTIVAELDKLYPKQFSETQLITSNDNTQVLVQAESTNLLVEPEQIKVPNSGSSNNYSSVASLLENQPEQVRIKKLIFCACREQWENDLSKLSAISLEILVSELHAIAPTTTELKLVLSNVVNTLNRKTEYLLVAETIIQAFDSFYPQSYRPAPVVQSPLSYQAEATSTQPLAYHTVPQVEPSLETVAEAESTYSPFDLRLEIMKYTNPLRAKILLFSVLKHKFSFSVADWSALKSCGLDDLLQQLLEQCDSLSTLESRLEIIASCLEDPFEYTQAAGAIIQSVKPVYSFEKNSQSLASFSPISFINHSSSAAPEVTRIEFGAEETLLTSSHTIAEIDDEQTCQFFSASKVPQSAVERSPSDLEQICELPNNSYEC